MRIPKQIQKTFHLLWALPLLFILSAPQTYAAGQKILASDGVDAAAFGNAISIDGNYAIIGAYNDDEHGANAGAAYVFYNGGSGWVQQKKLISSDIASGDGFGWSVSISGNYVIVGAPDNDDNGAESGSAYIFSRNEGGANNWGEVTKITASDAAENDLFGGSVAISGDYAVAGANGNEAAYIYYKDQGGAGLWGQVKKITASDHDVSSNFGSTVVISGTDVIVGAPLHSHGGISSGSAYVFSKDEGGADNWGEVKELLSSDRADTDNFGDGYSLAIDGDYLVVAATLHEVGANGNQGAVYVFYRDEGGADNWGEVIELNASDGAAEDYFGTSVSISGSHIIVGAYTTPTQSHIGSAYIFTKGKNPNSWTETKKLVASDGAAWDNFGWAVAIYGTNAMVGSVADDDNGDGSGSAYVFSQNQGGADNWGQLNGLFAGDGAMGDGLGYSVSIDGDYGITGAYNDDDNGADSGSAYVFHKVGKPVSQIKIMADDGAAGDNFGYSASISGAYAVVGAPYSSSNTGSAYVFSKDEGGAENWGQVAKLTADDGAGGDFFGMTVSISGDYAVVGAYGGEAAYVFYKDEGGAGLWGQVAKLTADDAGFGDYFGLSAAISGDYAVVGAYGNEAAYIFAKDEGGAGNWGQLIKLTADDGAAFDYFGAAVGIDGDYAVIGAYYDDDNIVNSGSAYIFAKDEGGVGNWGQLTKLTASDGATNDFFGDGQSVSINGNYVLIGAWGHDDNGASSGSAYLFSKDQGGVGNWGQVEELLADDGVAGDKFGYSAAISSSLYIIGAYGSDGNGTDSGSVYLYGYDSAVCGNNVIEGAEECDDGNTSGGDGCSAICMNEGGGCGGGDPNDSEVCLNGIVTGGFAMDAGADPDEMTVDPILMSGLDTDTAVTTLTIQNNNPAGFNITVQLTGGDTGTTTNTLGVGSLVLGTEGGSISFASTEGAELANGTPEADDVFATDDQVYESGTGDDGQCLDGTVVVTYTLSADEEVAPATYVGTAVYTMTAL